MRDFNEYEQVKQGSSDMINQNLSVPLQRQASSPCAHWGTGSIRFECHLFHKKCLLPVWAFASSPVSIEFCYPCYIFVSYFTQALGGVTHLWRRGLIPEESDTRVREQKKKESEAQIMCWAKGPFQASKWNTATKNLSWSPNINRMKQLFNREILICDFFSAVNIARGILALSEVMVFNLLRNWTCPIVETHCSGFAQVGTMWSLLGTFDSVCEWGLGSCHHFLLRPPPPPHEGALGARFQTIQLFSCPSVSAEQRFLQQCVLCFLVSEKGLRCFSCSCSPPFCR